MLTEAARDYARCREKAAAFDRLFTARAEKTGGAKYAKPNGNDGRGSQKFYLNSSLNFYLCKYGGYLI